MRTIDILCTQKDNSCNACPIKPKCDELDEATEFNLWEVYEQGRADERAKVIEEIQKYGEEHCWIPTHVDILSDILEIVKQLEVEQIRV